MSGNDLKNSILVLGCGNSLFGDDGFGPAVVRYFKENYPAPDRVLVQDAGTGIREILFELALGENKPRKLVIVDAVDCPGRAPGEVFELALDDLPAAKLADLSLHQFPTMNALRELAGDAGMTIHFVAAQVASLPREVQPGLSAPLTRALPEACRRLLALAVA
jgi:coenzyme F420 hydrogenase subunit delta